MNRVRAGRFLSLVLRHAPERIGLRLDDEGWADLDELVRRTVESSTPLTRELIDEIVRTNDKQRFKLSDDGLRIRAVQGHSLDVDLRLAPTTPPDTLYHGTALRFLDSILERGLVKATRHHVQLSADIQTARRVGERHGAPVVLRVRALEMHHAGMIFYRSENGVWLTDAVPPEFLERTPPE